MSKIFPSFSSLLAFICLFSAPAALAGENLLPNGDLAADQAGYRIYYKGANGQPLVNFAKVFKVADGVMSVDPGAAGEIDGAMLLFIDVPQEDIAEGATYTFSFDVKSEGDKTSFMMLLPGEVEPEKFTPDKENKGFTGPIQSDWKRVSKVFTTDAKYKNPKGELGITFLLKNVESPISLRNFELSTR